MNVSDFIIWQRHKDDDASQEPHISNLFKADGSNLAVQMRNLQRNLAYGYVVVSVQEVKPERKD